MEKPTSAELIAILAVGVTIGGLLFSNNRELRRDIADLRERMARLEGLFERPKAWALTASLRRSSSESLRRLPRSPARSTRFSSCR